MRMAMTRVRRCALCGEQHERITSRVKYGPFMDWELYHCPAIGVDEVGHDNENRVLYFGDEVVSLAEDSSHR
jgi:hypothetical protein